MVFLRQNATHKIVIGPVVAVGDGFTPVTTLSLGTADEAEAILHDNGTVIDISGYTFAAIAVADGYYHLTLQSGISGTIGHLQIIVNDDSLCLPVAKEFTVLEESTYDALFASAASGFDANQRVDVGRVLGTAQTAGDIPALVTTADTAIDGVQTDLDNAIDGLGALKALIDTLDNFVDTEVAAIKAVTDALPNAGALTSIAQASVCTESRLSELDAATAGKAANQIDIIQTDTTTDIPGTLATLATATNLATVDTVVDGIQTDLDNATDGLGAIKADTAAVLVDTGTTLDTKLNDIQGATFSSATDSLEAIRDHGDVAWVTGGGAGLTDILNVHAVLPISIDLANTKTVRLGLMLTNALDDLPSTAEITPGTISIERSAIGGTSWSAVVTNAACLEQAGLVYFDEVFDAGTGYAEGDSIRITFKSQKITVSANDYDVTDANGVMFQTHIRETMRGTDSANTTTPPTVVAIRTEMDSNSTELAKIGTPAGVSIAADIATVDTVADGIQTDLSNATDGLGALKTLIDTVDTVVDGIQTDLSNGIDGLGAIKADTAAVLTDTADMQPKLGAPAIDLSADIAAVKTDSAAILVDTAEIGTAGAGLTDLGGMSTSMKAEVNTEAKDVLFTDTDAEPGQGTPGATLSLAAKIGYLFKGWRNRSNQTATAWQLFGDDALTVDQKVTVSESGGTSEKGEVVTGP